MRVLLVVYDNGAYVHAFPIGTAYIASALIEAGHEVEIWSQDHHHLPDEALTEHLDAHRYDVVGIGIIGGYYQYWRLLGLAQAVNRSRQRPFFILGGFGPSPEPGFFMQQTSADAVVIGEGEITMVDLLDALANQRALKEVQGIAFKDGSDTIVTPQRPLIQDLDSIKPPAYHLFPVEYYRLYRRPRIRPTDLFMPMITSRGCTFLCTFCYRMDKGMRVRSSEPVVEEIQFLQREYGITYFEFVDELFLSSVARAEEMCEAFLRAELNIRWSCQGRLNYAKPELMALMRRAGCEFINYGIEAMDDTVLRNMKKGMRVDQVYEGINATMAAGISPGFNIIFGNIGDNRETLNKGVEFLLDFDDGAQVRTIRPVTPYPGSPLYYEAIQKGQLKDCYDFYHNKHTNSDLLSVNFTELSDDEFYAALKDANKRLMANYFKKKSEAALAEIEHLYDDRDPTFRGFRHT